MVWFADLSPWGGAEPFGDRLLAVGWLEAGRPFPTGAVDRGVFNRLVEFHRDPWCPYITMGFQRCDLCLDDGECGKDELFIPDVGRVFVAPQLVTNYMNAHGYRPPDEFCLAVLRCPPMRSMPYLKALVAAVPDFVRGFTRPPS